MHICGEHSYVGIYMCHAYCSDVLCNVYICCRVTYFQVYIILWIYDDLLEAKNIVDKFSRMKVISIVAT